MNRGEMHGNLMGLWWVEGVVATVHDQRRRRSDGETPHDVTTSVAERIDEWARWSA